MYVPHNRFLYGKTAKVIDEERLDVRRMVAKGGLNTGKALANGFNGDDAKYKGSSTIMAM
jgi:hypothetical protein